MILNNILEKIFGHKTRAVEATTSVEIDEALDKMNHDHLNWRESIVDLLKLLGLDSSLSARKDLARRLNYKGDLNDSATMNTWLIERVLQKFKEHKLGDLS